VPFSCPAKARVTVFAIGKRSFGQFVHDFIQLDEVSLTIDGVASTGAHLPNGFLDLDAVSLVSTVSLKGMGSLKSATIESFDLTTSTVSSINVVTSASLVNPSYVSTALGDVNFDVIFQGVTLGTLTSYSVVLNPGSNLLNMTGTLSPAPSDMPTANILFSNYLQGIPSSVIAQASVDASSNPTLNEGLQGFALDTVVPPTTVPLIAGIIFENLYLVPNMDNTAELTAQAQILFNSPLGPNSLLNVTALELISMSLLNNGTSIGAAVPPVLVSILATTSESVTISIGGLVEVPDITTFAAFIQQFLNSPNATVELQGVSNVTALTPIGQIELNDFFIDVTSTMIGTLSSQKKKKVNLPSLVIICLALNKLPGIVVKEFNLGGDDTSLTFNMTTEIPNPTIVGIDLGQLNFTVWSTDGIYVGSASTVGSMNMVPGTNTVVLEGIIDPSSNEFASELFSNYSSGSSQVPKK